MRALFVRFSAMGDCVMAAWPVTAFRQANPDAVIDWVVETRCADIVAEGDLVTERISFPRGLWKQYRWTPSMWRDQMAHYMRLRDRGYDLGIDFQGHSKTALCLALAKPKIRYGVFATDPIAARLNGWVGKKPPAMHHVDWMMEVLSRAGEYETPVRPIMPSVARSAAEARNQVGPGPMAVIAVSAGQPKNWVPGRTWYLVGERLRDQGVLVVYVGGGESSFVAPPGTRDEVGKTSLKDLMGTVAAADVVLAPDTGAGHLAAAYGVPVVSLFGANDPREFRPYTDRGTVLDKDATPEVAADAAMAMLKG